MSQAPDTHFAAGREPGAEAAPDRRIAAPQPPAGPGAASFSRHILDWGKYTAPDDVFQAAVAGRLALVRALKKVGARNAALIAGHYDQLPDGRLLLQVKIETLPGDADCSLVDLVDRLTANWLREAV